MKETEQRTVQPGFERLWMPRMAGRGIVQPEGVAMEELHVTTRPERLGSL